MNSHLPPQEATPPAPSYSSGASADHEHFPGLDTLRACAILLVIPRHAWEILRWPELKVFFGRHGWIGVDLFFALSGFLIGSQVFRSLMLQGRISFREFYLKRSFRILPSYLAVLAVYMVWPGFREVPDMQPLWRFLTFTMNLAVPRGSWAFSHAWSLCIEEHFYILFPAMAALCALRPRLLRPAVLVAAIVLGGMGLRSYLWSIDAPFYPAVYRPTYNRLDGLTLGLALAALRLFRPGFWGIVTARPWILFLAGIGLTALGVYVFGDLGDTKGIGAYVFTFPLVSTGFACLVAAAVVPGFWLARLRIPGVPFLAALAYTLYLIHKQMIHLAAQIIGSPNENKIATTFLSIALVGAAASVLHFAIEKPFLRLRRQLVGT